MDKVKPRKRVTLKDVAAALELSTATVSIALSGSPKADVLAPETRRRVENQAQAMGYRPNFLARSLRGKRTYSVGVLVPEISEGYTAGLMSGVEDGLAQGGYFSMMVSHRSRPRLLGEYQELLRDRGAEGFILIAAELEEAPILPAVVVSGHKHLDGVSQVVLDHDTAARQALGHLAELGHERVAFFRGSPGNVDAEDRWRSILEAASALGLEVSPELTLRLRGESYGATAAVEGGYREGYSFGKQLLARGAEFSALFAFNDLSAIGAVRAFREAGLRVPEDVSVIGFDDIRSALFHHPSLTTVRQPLREMGLEATRLLLRRLGGDASTDYVRLEPRLLVRSSTGRPPGGPGKAGRPGPVWTLGGALQDAGQSPPPRVQVVARKAVETAASKRVTLQDLSDHLQLSKATISRALSGSPQADALAPATRSRVVRAARKMGYRTNQLARSLRVQRTFSIGVLVPEISEGYSAGLVGGIESALAGGEYFYAIVSHRSQRDVLRESMAKLLDRGVEGLIVIAAELDGPPQVPAVEISGRQRLAGVSNVVLDHDVAAREALAHLRELGHERVAFFRGQAGNIDSDDRWRAIREAAAEIGLEVRDHLTLQLRGEAYGEVFDGEGGYREGYDFGRRLLDRGERFTALFAFNDISAIGALRAFQEAGLRVPEDVSVVGFDDIPGAPFHHPGLTTVRQPLGEMGKEATRILLRRIGDGDASGEARATVTLEPRLVVRGSTGPAPQLALPRPTS